MAQQTIYTIGHSTHPIDAFITILKAYNIKQVVDVRSIPKSRHNPQFNQDALSASLKNSGIEYVYSKSLGGLRHTRKDSINTAWRNTSFRGYADYMQTEEFDRAIATLIDVARSKTTAIMCAEAVPWRCHRSLIGDALLVRDVKVIDIMSVTNSREETLTGWAQVHGQAVTYPGEPETN